MRTPLILLPAAIVGCEPGAPVTIEPDVIPLGGGAVTMCLPTSRELRQCVVESLLAWESVATFDFSEFSSPAERCAPVSIDIFSGLGHYSLPLAACEDLDASLEFDLVARGPDDAVALGQYESLPGLFGFLGRYVEVPLIPSFDPTGVSAFIEVDGEWEEVAVLARGVSWDPSHPDRARFRVELTNPPRWVEFEMALPKNPRRNVHLHRGSPEGSFRIPVDDETFTWSGLGVTVSDGVLTYERGDWADGPVPHVFAEFVAETPWGDAMGFADWELPLTVPPRPAPTAPEVLVTGDALCPGSTASLLVQLPGADWGSAPPVSGQGVDIAGVTLHASDLLSVLVSVPEQPSGITGKLIVDGLELPLVLGSLGDHALTTFAGERVLLSAWTSPPGSTLLTPPGEAWWQNSSSDGIAYGLGNVLERPLPAVLRRDCTLTAERWAWTPTATSWNPPGATVLIALANSTPLPPGQLDVAVLDGPDDLLSLALERPAEGQVDLTPVMAEGAGAVPRGPVVVSLEGTVGVLTWEEDPGPPGPDDCDLPWIPEDTTGTWQIAGLPADVEADAASDDRVISVARDGFITSLEIAGPAGGGADDILLSSPSEGRVVVRSCRPAPVPELGVAPLSVRHGVWTDVHVRFLDGDEPGTTLFVGTDGFGEAELAERMNARDVRLRVRPESGRESMTVRMASEGRWWAIELNATDWWTWPDPSP